MEEIPFLSPVRSLLTKDEPFFYPIGNTVGRDLSEGIPNSSVEVSLKHLLMISLSFFMQVQET